MAMRHSVAHGVVVVAVMAASMALPATAAAPALTPDQQLVAGLERARSAARATLRGTPRLRDLSTGMRSAQKAAPDAVDALESPTMQAALRRGATLAREAREAHLSDDNALVRTKLRRLIALTSAALDDFGVPLEKDFASFAVGRAYPHLPEFSDYSGLSATVGDNITEVVIGAADRATANAGELGFVPHASSRLPITRISLAVFSDSIGRFSSGWCKLESGLITCRMQPAMPAELVFSIAFGPRLPKGTKLLVKFRSASGGRSFAVFTTR
jgi:hypothetical protein